MVVLLFAVIDVPMQKFLHANRMKMSLEEVKREHKETEGDPHIKGSAAHASASWPSATASARCRAPTWW